MVTAGGCGSTGDHLLGFQRNVRGYFAVADIGLLPSRFRGESAPLVIIECLQAGRPFVASDLGEIAGMLASEDGMAGAVLPLRGDDVDVPALQGLIEKLASDRAYYQAMADRVPAAAAKFDPAIMARKHDEAYRMASASFKSDREK